MCLLVPQLPPGLTPPTPSSSVLPQHSYSPPIHTTDVTAGGPLPCKQTINGGENYSWMSYDIRKQTFCKMWNSSESSTWLLSKPDPITSSYRTLSSFSAKLASSGNPGSCFGGADSCLKHKKNPSYSPDLRLIFALSCFSKLQKSPVIYKDSSADASLPECVGTDPDFSQPFWCMWALAALDLSLADALRPLLFAPLASSPAPTDIRKLGEKAVHEEPVSRMQSQKQICTRTLGLVTVSASENIGCPHSK